MHSICIPPGTTAPRNSSRCAFMHSCTPYIYNRENVKEMLKYVKILDRCNFVHILAPDKNTLTKSNTMKNTNTHTTDKVFTTKQIIYFLVGLGTFLTALSYLLIKANA